MKQTKKTAYICALLLFLVASYNHANNKAGSNKFINFTSEKETENSFYNSYEANWKNLDNFNNEFKQHSNRKQYNHLLQKNVIY